MSRVELSLDWVRGRGVRGLTTSSEIGAAKFAAMTKDKTALTALFGEDYATDILAEKNAEKRGDMVRERFAIQTAETRTENLRAAHAGLMMAHEAQQSIAEDTTREAASYGVAVKYNGKAWTVTLGDGSTVQVDSAEAAERIKGDLLLAANEQEAAALVSQVETWASERPDIRREATLTGDMVERKAGKLQATDAAGVVREINNASMLASVRAQTVGMGQNEMDVAVNGTNAVFAESVGEAAEGLVQTITVNRARNQVAGITFLHEKLEANLKAAGLSNLVSAKEVQTALSVVANALPIEPVRARLESLRKRGAHQDHIDEAEGELALRERLHKVAAGKGSEAEMREVAVELAVAEVLGRDKRGGRTGLAPGALNKMLGEAAMQATTAAEVQALGKFRAFLRSVRAWLRGVLGTVAGIEKARREGKLKEGDNFGALVDTMLGLEGSKFSKAVESEAHSLAGVNEGQSFSLSQQQTFEHAIAAAQQVLATQQDQDSGIYRPELSGNITFTFGPSPGTEEKGYHDGAGLEHIMLARIAEGKTLEEAAQHLAKVVEAVAYGTFDPSSLTGKVKPIIRYQGLRVVLSRQFSGKDVRWLVTGYVENKMPTDATGGESVPHRATQLRPVLGQTKLVAVDSGKLPSGLPAVNGSATHSLSPVRRMELVENRLAVVLNQDSEQARKFAERGNERLGRLKSRYAGVPAPKTKAELDKQQAGMVEARRAELEEMMVGEVEQRMGGVHGLVTKLREHPLGDYLLRSDMRRKRLYLGSLMSPARWRAEQLARSGTVPGDYDGADGLPGMFFRGNLRPDDVAKELHGLGIIKGDSADDLWAAMDAMMGELATNKEAMQKYREQLREARQTAKEEAEYEGRAWRAEEDEQQAFLANPRDAAMRDVAALDAITMAMPVEARAKLPRGLNALVAGLLGNCFCGGRVEFGLDVERGRGVRGSVMSAGIEMMTERIGDLNLIKSPGRGMKAVGSIAKEGLVEEGLAQAAKDVALNPITLEREATLDNVPGAMLAGSLAAVPLAGFGAVVDRPRFANVTDGSREQTAPPGSSASVPAIDAGSTPAVGSAFNPGDVHPVTGKTVEAVFTGANGAREIAYTDGTSEVITATPQPSNQTDVREVLDTSDPAQDAAAEAALAAGPKSMMAVATRQGKVDSHAALQAAESAIQTAPPEQRAAAVQAANQAEAEIIAKAAAPQPGARLQFAKKPLQVPDYASIRRGHPVRAVKRLIQRAADAMNRLVLPADPAQAEQQARAAVAELLRTTPAVTDAQGTRVLLASPETRGTVADRDWHLIASHDRADRYKKGPRFFNANKAASVLAVPTTVKDYHIKAHDPKSRTTLYLRRYADGKMHAVFTDSNHRVTEAGEFDGGLASQRSADPIDAFEGFVVEDRRTPGEAFPPKDTAQGPKTQEAAKSQSPQGQTTPRVQESKRFVPGAPLSTLIKDTRAVAQSAARLLNQQLPGIVGPKLTFVSNPAELLASNYAAENSFTAEEQAQMQDAEAFYDNDTGHTIVFTDAIEVRPGESDRAAVARVILHERVGHDGFNALHQNDSQFRAKWNSIAKDIPSAEMDAIARDYPHLAGDKHQLALEWFARAVEQRLHLKEGNLARRLWLAFKAFVQRLRDGFANTEAWVHEDALKELITKAREAAQNGTAVPTTAEGLRQRLQFTGDAPQRDDLDLGEAVAQIEAFYADPVETDYWPTDLVKKWEDDPLRVAVEDDGDFLAAVPHLPEALRNSPQVQAWTAAYQRYDELQRKSLNTPLTAAEADESDAFEDPTNEALDWLDSPDVQSALASRKSALETAVEARAAQTIQQIESTGRYKWNRKSKSFDAIDDDTIRVQFSLAKQGAAPQAARHDSRQHTSLGAMPGVSPQQQSESVKRRVMGAVNAARITFARFGTPITEARTEAEAKALGIDDDHWIGVGPRGLVFVPHRAPERLTDRFADAAVQEEVIHIGWMRALDEQAKAKGIPYQHHVTAQMGAMLRELDASPTGQRAFMEAANLYDRVNARSRGAYRNYKEARAAKLDRDVRPYFQDLTALRDQLASTLAEYSQRGQFPDNPLRGTGKLNKALGGSRVFHDKDWVPGAVQRLVPALRAQGNQPFRVNNLGLRTLLQGSALPQAFHETVEATERQRRALDQVAAQIGRDLQTAVEGHAKATGMPLAQVYDMVHTAMNGAPGTNAVLLAVNPTLAERARVARNFIDDMSVVIAGTLPKGTLRNNIILNQGSWLRCSYAAFDPASNWNFDNVMQAARAGEQLGGRAGLWGW